MTTEKLPYDHARYDLMAANAIGKYFLGAPNGISKCANRTAILWCNR